MKRTLRGAILLVIALSVTAFITACSSHRYNAPSMMGENGHCYYWDDPYEARALAAAGQCPANWSPAPAPPYWRARYSSYYEDQDYYGRYVPKSRRAQFVHVTHQWVDSNQTLVKREAPKAAPRRFTSGDRSKSFSGGENSHSSGSRRSSSGTSVRIGSSSGSRSYTSGRR